MGNVCLCDEMPHAVHQQLPATLSLQPPRPKFHTIAASELRQINNDPSNKSLIKQSAINIRASSLHQSSNQPSLIRSSEVKHKLVVDPPSECNQEMLQKLQNMSQVPSDFFNNANLSVYFRDSKSRISKKFSFKEGPKVSLQSKHSREDDFENLVLNKNQQNSLKKGQAKLMPSLIKEQNIRVTRSELKQGKPKEDAVMSSLGLKSTTKSMIRPKADSSLKMSTPKNKRDLETVN